MNRQIVILTISFFIFSCSLGDSFEGTWRQANSNSEILISSKGGNNYRVDISSELIQGLNLRGSYIGGYDYKSQKQVSLITGLSFRSSENDKNEIESIDNSDIKIIFQDSKIIFRGNEFRK